MAGPIRGERVLRALPSVVGILVALRVRMEPTCPGFPMLSLVAFNA